MRKLLKTIPSGVMIFVLVFSCVFSPVFSLRPVSADTGSVGSLVSFLMSALGVLNTTSGGAVQQVGTDITSAVTDYVTEQMGSGITVDSNGNYVFSNDFSQGLYDILNSQSGIDARVVSASGSGKYLNWAYINGTFQRNFIDKTQLYNNHFDLTYQFNSGNYICTSASIYDLSNVGAVIINDYGNLLFYNANLNLIDVPCSYVYLIYNYVDGYFGTCYSWNGSTTNKVKYANGNQSVTDWGVFTQGEKYNKIPEGSDGGYRAFNISANRSWTLAKNSSSANFMNNRTTGTQYVTSSFQIPSVSQTVVQNNDWNTIYNNYVSNVVTQYNNDEDKTSDMDLSVLRKWMRTYTKSIVDAINSGVDDILTQVLTTNTWLKRIYDRLGSIYDLLADLEVGGGSSGGGSCAWTSSDIDEVITALQYIEDNIYDYTPALSTMTTHLSNISSSEADSYLKLGQIYVILGTILQAIRSGHSPSDSIDNTFPDLFDFIHDLPDSDILDSISSLDVASSMFEDVVPFCFLGATVAIVTGLSHEPVVINTRIPFKVTSSTGFSVDDGITIDLTPFQTVHDILIASECIAFILLLMWISFKLLYYFLNLLGG